MPSVSFAEVRTRYLDQSAQPPKKHATREIMFPRICIAYNNHSLATFSRYQVPYQRYQASHEGCPISRQTSILPSTPRSFNPTHPLPHTSSPHRTPILNSLPGRYPHIRRARSPCERVKRDVQTASFHIESQALGDVFAQRGLDSMSFPDSKIVHVWVGRARGYRTGGIKGSCSMRFWR